MLLLSILLALLSFKNQNERGSLLTSFLLFYVFMGIFAGYQSARTYKMFEGIYWIRCAFLTSVLYPGIIFLIVFILNIAFAIQ